MPALRKSALENLDRNMAGFTERGEIPGIAAAVRRNGETHILTAGNLSFEEVNPVRQDTIFRVASMSKPVTAVAAMILVEECRLRLDDPVDPFLPELANPRVLRQLDGPLEDTVPADRPITLRDLLTLRLGAGYQFDLSSDCPYLQARKEAGILQGPPRPFECPPPDEWMRRVGSLPLMYQPGARWMYDLGLEVISVLVARASGQRFEEFLHDRIFGPLGMRDTDFFAPPEKVDRLATSYWTNFVSGKTEVFDPAANGAWSRAPAFPSGAGGLVSTVGDFLDFGEMMLRRGKLGSERILSPATVELMTQGHLTPAQRIGTEPFLGADRSWGLGMSVYVSRSDVASSPGSFGWDGGLGSSWFSDPANDLVGVLLTQMAWTSPNPPPVWRDFWTGVYAALDE